MVDMAYKKMRNIMPTASEYKYKLENGTLKVVSFAGVESISAV